MFLHQYSSSLWSQVTKSKCYLADLLQGGWEIPCILAFIQSAKDAPKVEKQTLSIQLLQITSKSQKSQHVKRAKISSQHEKMAEEILVRLVKLTKNAKLIPHYTII